MTPFQPGRLDLPPVKLFIRELMDQGLTRSQAKYQYTRLKQDEIWVNDLYQVNVNRHGEPHPFGPDVKVIHLSVKRRDKAPIHDWRHLQRIKSELVGPEYEAIELYPAESRVVDVANQFHLWCFTTATGDPMPFPVGFRDSRHVDYESKHGAIQRPLEHQG